MDVKETNPFLLLYEIKNVPSIFFDLKKVILPPIDYLLVDLTNIKFLLKLIVLKQNKGYILRSLPLPSIFFILH